MTSIIMKRRLAALEAAAPHLAIPAGPYPGLVEAIRRRAEHQRIQPIQPDEVALLRRMAADLGKVSMFSGADLHQMTDHELATVEFFLWHAEHLRATESLYPRPDTIEQWRSVFEQSRSCQPKGIGAMWVASAVRNRAEGEPPPLTMLLALGITPQADEGYLRRRRQPATPQEQP